MGRKLKVTVEISFEATACDEIEIDEDEYLEWLDGMEHDDEMLEEYLNEIEPDYDFERDLDVDYVNRINASLDDELRYSGAEPQLHQKESLF